MGGGWEHGEALARGRAGWRLCWHAGRGSGCRSLVEEGISRARRPALSASCGIVRKNVGFMAGFSGLVCERGASRTSSRAPGGCPG